MSNSHLGLVVIGRNEGIRLQQCLHSVIDHFDRIVYVDSGSTDGSVTWAQTLGVEVVALDLTYPFTAARARNAGFAHLIAKGESPFEFVQFMDGDCEVAAGWVEAARSALEAQANIAVVCGRRRERYPQASIYNQLCDIEWDTPVGEAQACGGDAMMRVSAFQQVAGFNELMIAGEEPELCLRLRQQGWQIYRLAQDMTLHDANMTHWRQWWKRFERSGHAYAEGAYLHGSSQERYGVRASLSIWFWGFLFPTMILGGAVPTSGLSLALFLSYPWLAYRVYCRLISRGYGFKASSLYALSCTLGKVPNFIGQCRFWLNTLLKRQKQLIEYK